MATLQVGDYVFGTSSFDNVGDSNFRKVDNFAGIFCIAISGTLDYWNDRPAPDVTGRVQEEILGLLHDSVNLPFVLANHRTKRNIAVD